jgi:isocitrate dehydrogenase kinase/phosphatase
MVKRIDRAGRLADTLEYADVAIPKARFSAEALLELRSEVASLVSEEADVIVLKHVYIERRMTPLDLALRRERGSALEQLVDDWGSCLEELATANIFAGDLLSKNFGVTRLGRVVFYDYDELDSVTATTFRTLPKALDDDDELRNEAWFHVGPKDVFPEEWRPFLLTDTHIARVFEEKHRGLFTAEFWNAIKERLESGRPLRVSPYPDSVRFSVPHREDTSQNVRRPR